MRLYRRFEIDSVSPIAPGSDLSQEVQIDTASVVHTILEVVTRTQILLAIS